MKFATIALATTLALSSTFALAYTNHHKTYHHHGRYYGSSNNRAGLVGGADPGTYGVAAGAGVVRGGGVSSSDYALYIRNQHDSGLARSSNSRGNLVGGADSGVRKP